MLLFTLDGSRAIHFLWTDLFVFSSMIFVNRNLIEIKALNAVKPAFNRALLLPICLFQTEHVLIKHHMMSS
jgi:hypothetical protein